MRPNPALMEAGDGRCGFALSNGLGFIDPTQVARNTAPPQVSIQAVSAADAIFRLFRKTSCFRRTQRSYASATRQ